MHARRDSGVLLGAAGRHANSLSAHLGRRRPARPWPAGAQVGCKQPLLLICRGWSGPDASAFCARRRFRILAAGGDGTVAWILKTVMELGLEPAPPVAVLPLGTGNDLSLSFGWGNTFQQAWIDVRARPAAALKG